MLSKNNLYDELKADGPARERAYSALRQDLLRAMSAKLKALYGVDDEFVADIVQETMLVVLNKLETFRGDSSVFTWASAIAVRIALSEFRRKRWKDFSLDELTADTTFEPAAPDADLSENLAAKEELKIVKNAINEVLTEKQRQALLAELEGMTTSEIARRCGTTSGAIYKLTHDARRALLSHFKKTGFLEEVQ